MPWATVADVAAYTGAEVSDAQVFQAQAVVDLFSNTTEAASADMKARDRGRLRYAVAYQAAWAAEQVDVTSRTEVTDVRQDGMWFTPGHEDALFLAPLARRWLMRLSWRRSRSVQVRPPGSPDPASAAGWLSEAADERDPEPWVPL